MDILTKSKNSITFLFFVSIVILTGCQDNRNVKPAPKPTVPAIKVTSSEIPVYKEYIGITQSIASIGIRARVKGFLTKMNFIEGKPVKEGQLLFVIDPRPFEAKLELAKGQLDRSIANQDFQKVQYERMKELIVKGDVSQSRYDEVHARYREAEADVEVNKAKVDEAEINLGFCYMYSPVDGIIGEKYVDVGNLVGGTENTLLANVVKLDPIYIQFSPSVNDFGEFLNYRANMPFKVEARLPQNKSLIFHGKIDLINNQADVPTSTVLTRAIIDNPEKLLLPGIYMNVKVLLSDKGKAILIPATAVLEIQGKKAVYVVNQDNKIEARSITTGGQYKEQNIVESGLQVGEVIMTSGMQKVKPGEEVNVNLVGQ
ncbi:MULTISPECIES: efflux RND transporter periplasmic adaptor subunit [unclassified Legionella]|uniref:efflux RND transporter periplasmic adaptor subunit n=1 Tax=unclassified Legionella TaxID=2622702 RepID=UPI001056DE8F|nr:MULTISPECIES: efflux RND transporter periplasmic adaptor subunit [unclassified Legionella]MDI9818337.1 efflux RND transporter periplasmic adaptor subunit [Legionella sp. PL877]